MQEESASLIGGSLKSALAPKANSTVKDLTMLKTGLKEDCKACTPIAKKVAAAMELGRQATSLRREITRPRQSFCPEGPRREGIPLQEALPGRFWTEVQKATALQEDCYRGKKVEGVTLEPGV